MRQSKRKGVMMKPQKMGWIVERTFGRGAGIPQVLVCDDDMPKGGCLTSSDGWATVFQSRTHAEIAITRTVDFYVNKRHVARDLWKLSDFYITRLMSHDENLRMFEP